MCWGNDELARTVLLLCLHANFIEIQVNWLGGYFRVSQERPMVDPSICQVTVIGQALRFIETLGHHHEPFAQRR